MVCKRLIMFGSLFVVLIMASAIRGEILGDYLGYSACSPFHPDITAGWEATPHAKAFETLKTQGEEKQEKDK